MSKEIQKWADSAMFEAEQVDVAKGPQVYLLEMTSDPLGSIAALSAMYTGKVTRSKDDVTDEQRDHHLREMQLTKLTTPLESVKIHFMLEGVTRAFTHQLVRNRTSAYAQESMRFAVKEDMPVALPPSLAGTISYHDWIKTLPENQVSFQGWFEEALSRESERQQMRLIWDREVIRIRQAYNDLVNMGMPAEDARGLAPTNVMTRINWVTDLRTLIDQLGVRLCTQAQFEWRVVAIKIAEAIAGAYERDRRWVKLNTVGDESPEEDKRDWLKKVQRIENEYSAIAGLFRPICYKTGKCEFMSDADRACSIRSRVQANHDIGRPSSAWGEEYDRMDPHEIVVFNPDVHTARSEDGTVKFIGAITPAEWLLDPTAARS